MTLNERTGTGAGQAGAGVATMQDTDPETDAGTILPAHGSGCACPGCARHEPDETGLAAGTDGLAAGSAGTLSAPAMLGDMADFLRQDFWTQYGTVSRKFNLTDSGTNAKNGVLHYNVSGFQNAGGAGSDADGISAARADLVRDVLDLYSDVLGITFVETTSSDTSVTDLFFKDNAGGAFASSAGYSEGIQYSWINVATNWSGGTSTYNDYTLQTLLHEVGHALGLGHQGLYNGTGSYPDDADFVNDSWQASMMSYFSQSQNTTIAANFAFLQTPMTVDWMALDDIYGDQSFGGTDFGVQNAFAGDTVYGFNTTIAASDNAIWAAWASVAGQTASTLVDGGGTDTLDVSGFGADQRIDLRAATRTDTAPPASNIGGKTGNLTIAEGTVIENAVGGAGDDLFIGNAAANVFTGNGGNDVFRDSAGGDTYLGGAGTDRVDFLGLFADYSFALSGSFLAVAGAAVDLVESTVEFLGFDDLTLGFAEIVAGLGGNAAPEAGADAYAVAEDTILGGNLLDNDTDPDGDALSVVAVAGDPGAVGGAVALASGAVVTVGADGGFIYDQNGAFDFLGTGESATDSFSYTLGDGQETDTATVTIAISGVTDNRAPLAADDSFATAAGGSAGGNLLDNDTDPDGDALSVVAVAGDPGAVGGAVVLASGAVVTVGADGSLAYETGDAFDFLGAGESATDSFSYRVSDGAGATATATASVTVTGTDPGPVAGTPVLVDFEDAARDVYSGIDAVAMSGVRVWGGGRMEGEQCAMFRDDPFVMTATGADFDLDSIALRRWYGDREVRILAYDDGELVGALDVGLPASAILSVDLDDRFDSVDRVEVVGAGGFWADDIALITYA